MNLRRCLTTMVTRESLQFVEQYMQRYRQSPREAESFLISFLRKAVESRGPLEDALRESCLIATILDEPHDREPHENAERNMSFMAFDFCKEKYLKIATIPWTKNRLLSDASNIALILLEITKRTETVDGCVFDFMHPGLYATMQGRLCNGAETQRAATIYAQTIKTRMNQLSQTP